MILPKTLPLLRRLLPLLALCLLLGVSPARAAITCVVTMDSMSFGTVDPLNSLTNASTTLHYKCTNTGAAWWWRARVCFSISEPAPGNTNDRRLRNGGNNLNFLLYKDPAHIDLWGSQFQGSATPASIDTGYLYLNNSATGTVTLYGQVLAGQNSTIPGGYVDTYTAAHTFVTVNDVAWPGGLPAACDTAPAGSFPFIVKADVVKKCEITGPTADANLGSHPSTAINVTGTGGFRVTCSRTTPYFIGLRPSNNNANGAGTMKAPPPNTDQVPYQLYQDAGYGTIWGNTATDVSPGNGVGDTGTGSVKGHTVYVRAPSANYQPDNYADTVTITVNY